MKSSPGAFSPCSKENCSAMELQQLWLMWLYPAVKAASSSLPSGIGLYPEPCSVFLDCFFPCNLGLVIWDDSRRNAKGCGCFLPLAEACHVLGAYTEGWWSPSASLCWLRIPLGLLSGWDHRVFLIALWSFQSKVKVWKELMLKQATCFLQCLHPFGYFSFSSRFLSIIRFFQLFFHNITR